MAGKEDSTVRCGRWCLVGLVLSVAIMVMAQDGDENVFDTPDPFDENVKTGIAVGERIPAFEGRDPQGKLWTFDDIKGPKGALLLFYRSADW